MAVPSELSLGEIRNFMLKNGGKVTNHELVKHFKQFLTHPKTKGKCSVSTTHSSYRVDCLCSCVRFFVMNQQCFDKKWCDFVKRTLGLKILSSNLYSFRSIGMANEIPDLLMSFIFMIPVLLGDVSVFVLLFHTLMIHIRCMCELSKLCVM